MGYFILYKNEGGFFGNIIQRTQLKVGFSADHAKFTHVEVSGGGQWSVRVAPPRVKVVDITKHYKGRYIRIVRFKNKKYEEIIKACENALEKNSKFKEAWYHMGISQYKLSRFDQAESSSLKALEIDKEYKDALFCLSVSLFRQKKYMEAEEANIKLLKIDRNNKQGLHNLRIILHKQGKLKESKKILKGPENKNYQVFNP